MSTAPRRHLAPPSGAPVLAPVANGGGGAAAVAAPRLHIALPDGAPAVTTYAGAARALGSNRTPVDARLAVARGLLEAAPALRPDPLSLVGAHAAYVVCNASAAGADARARAAYWRLLGTTCDAGWAPAAEGHGVGEAAARALREGEAAEVEAVMGVLARAAEWVGGGLEGRAELVAAVIGAVRGRAEEARGRCVVKAWAEAQARCGNAKRVSTAVVRFVLPCLVDARGGRWGVGLCGDVATVAVRGLFAVPAAALEGGGYYREVFSWLRGACGSALLPDVAAWMMRGFIGRVREEAEGVGPAEIPDSRKRKWVNGDDVYGVLPQSILVPLVFFKDILATMRSVLEEPAAEGVESREQLIRAFASVFKAAADAGVYRTSYDMRPTVKLRKRANGEREGSDDVRKKMQGKSTGANQEACTKPGIGLPDPSLGINVGLEIAAVVRVLASSLEQASSSKHPSAEFASAISDALASVLSLSVDAVIYEIPNILTALGRYAGRAPVGDGEVCATVIAALLSSYASTRQLPELGTAIGSASSDLTQLLAAKCVMDTLSTLFVVAPRGHAAAFVRGLFPSTEPVREFHCAQLVTMASVVLETSPVTEHVDLAHAISETVLPAIYRSMLVTGNSNSLLQTRASVLFAMADAGIPLTSPIFTKCLFDDTGPGCADEGESSPDSDSSDFESFMDQRRRQESPRARFVQMLALGTSWKSQGGSVAKKYMKRKRSRHKDDVSLNAGQGKCNLNMEGLLPSLRFIASLAHVCAVDPALCGSRSRVASDGPSSDQISGSTPPTSPTHGKKSANDVSAKELALREVWNVFEAINISEAGTMVGGDDYACPVLTAMVLAGGSVIGLIESSVDDGSGNENASVSVGFRNFLTLALIGGDRLDSLWDELWESCSLRKVLVRVISGICSLMPRFAQNIALKRCSQLPLRYLSLADEEALSTNCLRVASAVSVDCASKSAMRVMARMRFLPEDLCDVETLSISLVGSADADDADFFIALLMRKGPWMVSRPAVKQRRQLLSSMLEHCNSLDELAWFLRCICRALDEQKDDCSLSAAKLSDFVKATLFKVEKRFFPHSTVPSAYLVTQGLLELVICIRNVADHRTCASRDSTGDPSEGPIENPSRSVGNISTSGIDFDEAKRVLRACVVELLPLCSASLRQPLPAMISCLNLFVHGGDRSPCSMIFCGGQDISLKVRVAALCVSWLRQDEKTSPLFFSPESDPSAVLMTLLSGSGHRSAVARTVCDALRLELDEGAVGLAHASRVVLSSGCSDHALALACLESVVREMRVWGFFEHEANAGWYESDETNDGRAKRFRSRLAIVHEAVAGVEAWSRAQAGRSVRSTTERFLQLLSRVMSSRHVSDKTMQCALRVVTVFVKQSSGSHASSSQVSSGVLWSAERVLCSLLSHSSQISESTAVDLSRSFESIAKVGSGTTQHATALTAASMTALARVKSAAVRRAMLPGISSLLAAGDSSDAIARAAMTLLRDDVEKDIFRSLRSEIIDSDVAYKGRA